MQQAVALNSLGVNIARAIGPALGGVIIAASGPGAVFAANALSILGILAVLARWRRDAPDRHLPAEHMVGAMRAGLRYALRAPELKVVLIRSVGFFLFASGLWALLPVIARRDLELGPLGYGGLLSFGPITEPLMWTFVWAVGIFAVTAPLAMRAYKRKMV